MNMESKKREKGGKQKEGEERKSDDTKWQCEKRKARGEKGKGQPSTHDTLLPASFRVWRGNRRVDQFN